MNFTSNMGAFLLIIKWLLTSACSISTSISSIEVSVSTRLLLRRTGLTLLAVNTAMMLMFVPYATPLLLVPLLVCAECSCLRNLSGGPCYPLLCSLTSTEQDNSSFSTTKSSLICATLESNMKWDTLATLFSVPATSSSTEKTSDNL